MRSRFAYATLLLIVSTLLVGLSGPAAAQSPAKSYEYRQQRFRHACRPPLKFAAGTCVRYCPAGYRNNGGYCRLMRG